MNILVSMTDGSIPLFVKENMLDTIKELRARTHLGLSECQKALVASNGDINQAIEFLQKSGSIKKADSVAVLAEGLVKAKSFGSYGLIIEINCQTDFGARSEQFQNLVNQVLDTPPNALAEKSIMDDITFTSRQLGENVQLRRKSSVIAADGSDLQCVAYSHHNGKVAVLLQAEVKGENTTGVSPLLEEICMQIVATNPSGLNREAVLEQEAKQKEIFLSQVPVKAADKADKIVQGKIEKWYGEVVLLDQEFLLYSKKTVKQVIQELEKTNAIELNLVKFIRYELGGK